jgi:rhamnosyltransferase
MISPDTLKNLREGLEALQERGLRVAVVGPGQVDLRTGAEYPQRRIQGASMAMIWPSEEADAAIEVSFLITSGSLIEVKTFDLVGTMRADFFIDYIDIEWCFRAAALGLRIYCIRSVTIRHAMGDRRRKFLGREISLHSPLRQYYMFRNVLALARMPTVPLRFRVIETLFFLSRAPVFLILSGISWDHVRLIALGVAHGLTGRLGPLKR